MSEFNLQESAPSVEALPQSSATQLHPKNHSELSNPSQSLREVYSDTFKIYYGTFDQQAMQSISTSDSKACQKRDSTCSIRNGFIAKKHLHTKKW